MNRKKIIVNTNCKLVTKRFLLQELYDNLEKERPKLFRLASDTDEKDAEGISKFCDSLII